jgi:uncharacterized integral membrane protein (TIGR00697 family)
MSLNRLWQADNSLALLACAYSGSLVLAAVLASKIITVGPLVVPAGVLPYSVTFIVTDVVSEVWGKKQAKHLVMGGFVTLVLAFLLISMSIISA